MSHYDGGPVVVARAENDIVGQMWCELLEHDGIDAMLRVVGHPIVVGTNPVAIAFTPNGTRAYVVNKGSNSVTPIYLPNGVTGTPIPVGHDPVAIAISPIAKRP